MDIFIPVVTPPRLLLVAAYVSPHLWPPLRAAIGERCRIAQTESWDELRELVQERPIDVVIADPAAAGRASAKPIEQLLTQFPRTPMFVYTTLQAESLQSITALLRERLSDVLLQGVDDAPESFQRAIETADQARARNPVFERLSAAINTLPATIRRALEDLFRRPHIFLTVSDIAGVAGMTLNRFYRAFHATTIQHPRRVFVAARVYRAYAYLREPGHSVRHVAAKLRYRHARMLARHTYESLRLKPRHLRGRVTERVVIDQLAAWIYTESLSEGLEEQSKTEGPPLKY
jgi:AraC-like DNA-binding protein